VSLRQAVPTILGIRLGYHVLSPNMYQYMPETWILQVTSNGNFSLAD